MIDETTLNIIRLITGVVILSYAAYTDIKTRKAANILWVIMGGIGVGLLIIQAITIGFENLYYLLFIPIMIGLIYGFYQFRLIFGGADAKALMALSILVPIYPTISQFPVRISAVPSIMPDLPAPWIIFSNSVIIFLIIPLSLLLYNLIKRDVAFPHSFLGYTMSVADAKQTFVWPLEKIVDGKRKFVYMPKDFDTDKELEEFEKLKIEKIWVTPKIPFMIPLLLGFIETFLIGDILISFMRLFI
ncbi:MAG: prepilin peptidase [Euryarchaeota archaeon]|nr:prepilin peptidase [Euryarchaeota archaeon]